MMMQDVRAAAAPEIDLFDAWPGSMTRRLDPSPRSASNEEVEAYARWLAAKAGLPEMQRVRAYSQVDHRGRTISQATHATFGCVVTEARWEGRERIEATYEDGAYSIVIPHIARQVVMMETLDEAGEVVATSTLPVEPKKHGVVWDKAAVRAACGPIAKARRPAKVKAAPVPAETPPAVEMTPATPTLDTAALLDRIARLESIVDDLMVIALREQSPAPPAVENVPVALPADPRVRAVASRSPMLQAIDAGEHDRARRLRIVRRYLAMRAERAALRAQLSGIVGQLKSEAARADDEAFRANMAEIDLEAARTRLASIEASQADAIDKATARIVALEDRLRSLTPPPRSGFTMRPLVHAGRPVGIAA